MKDNKALDEIQRLNNKKVGLEGELKILTRDIEKSKDILDKIRSEISQWSETLKAKRKDGEELKHVVAALQESVAKGELELKNQGQSSREQHDLIKEKEEVLEKTANDVLVKTSQLKEKSNQLDTKKVEILKDVKELEKAQVACKQEIDAKNKELTVTLSGREQFEKEKKKVERLQEDLEINTRFAEVATTENKEEQFKYKELIKANKSKEASLDIATKNIETEKARYEKLNEQLKTALKSTSAEKVALEQAEKELQIKQLRFKKQVNDANLGTELENLKRE